MKTFNIKTQSTKALLLGALTLTPALALTNTAEAAPRGQAPTWDNQHSNQDRNNHFENYRFDNNRPNTNGSHSSNNGSHSRYDYQQNNKHDDYRFENYHNDNHRVDYGNGNHGYGNNKGTDTKKLLGAGIIGAIIGAVIAH